jgi:hypothetical protein
MAVTRTNDISRMIVLGNSEVFTKNWETYPREYPQYTTPKTADKKTMYYDSMGNLPAAAEKPEGGAIQYGKLTQAYQTSVTIKTWANGYSHTMEAIKFDLQGVVNSAKAKELARTMAELEENNAVYWLNNADNAAVTLADGVPMLSNSHPLVNAPGEFNDNLFTGALTPDNVKAGLKLFNSFKNHQGGPMKSDPDRFITHKNNMWTVQEIFGSDKKAYELSNTKNSLAPLKNVFLRYLADENRYFMEDTQFDHVLFVSFMKTAFDEDEDKIGTKDMYFNAIAMYNTCAVPNIGLVGSTG